MTDTAQKSLPKTPKNFSGGLKKSVPKTPVDKAPARQPQVQSKPENMSPSAISDDEQLTNGTIGDDEEEEDDFQEQEQEQEGSEEESEQQTERDPNEATAGATEQAGNATEAKTDAVDEAGESGEEIIPAGRVNEKGEVVDDAQNVIGKISDGDTTRMAGSIVSQEGEVLDQEGNVLGSAQPVEGAGLEEGDEIAEATKEPAKNATGTTMAGAEENVEDATDEENLGDIKDDAGGAADLESKASAPEIPEIEQPELKGPFKVGDDREVIDAEGNRIGSLDEKDSQNDSLTGKDFDNIDSEGNIVGEDGQILGKVNLLPVEELPGAGEAEKAAKAKESELKGPFKIGEKGEVLNAEGRQVGDINIEGSQAKSLIGKEFETIDDEGQAVDKENRRLGKVNLLPDLGLSQGDDATQEAEEAAGGDGENIQLPDVSILEGLKVNKTGNVVDEDGNVMGKIVDGDIKKLAGKQVNKDGKVWNDKGDVIGTAEVVPEALENQTAPFEDFPDAIVDKDGNIVFDGQAIGKIVEGDIQKLIGKKVDADGDVTDKNGNVIGKAERLGPKEPEPEPEEVDYSMLADKKINKAGNVVDENGAVVGRVVEGTLKYLVGKRVDKNGEIWNDSGKVIGKAEPIPATEKEDYKEPAAFEDFSDATVQSNGDVLSGGEKIGILIEGDAKKLKGKSVDADGDVVDRNGNVLGRAERWEAPEEEAEPEVDMSILAGKRVNKAGNVVDKSGDIYGRLIEGDAKTLAGKMCDKLGFIRNEGGDVVGKAALVPQSEREGMKEGPFTDFEGCTVAKEGKVTNSAGVVVGRLIDGDEKKLFGRAVDDDGDILDKNGNVLGRAERWEEPEVERDVNPMSGRKVNKKGEVVNEDGDTIGRLTEGDLGVCAGKKIDDDGDVVDAKGTRLGHVNLLEDIPEPEPEGETDEEKQERQQREQDKKLAAQMSVVVEQSLEKIKPVLKMITQTIDKEERKPEEERDEEALVREVKPMIEEGGRILTEANGAIRGMDPDGRIQANAKHKTAAREASPEEYRLAELLKDLTGGVTETIENAKRKIQDMPHAKKELNPLWALLAEPLGQILAAVGLLLAGVLGLVGKLLSGLGLGGLLDNLLGGLGLKNILGGLGLGGIVSNITGKKKK